jgi:hypothetical protein
MATTLDLTDIPPVAPEDLAVAMRLLIDSERALALLHGAAEADMRDIEQAFWQQFDGDTALGLAVLLRFRNLIDVFSARRLKELLLHRGYGLIASAVTVASAMRLNARWGFNPQKFLRALNAIEAELADVDPPVAEPEFFELRLAA